MELTPSAARDIANSPVFAQFYVVRNWVFEEIYTPYGRVTVRREYEVSDPQRFIQFCEDNSYAYRV